MLCVVSWLLPRDYWYHGSVKTKHEEAETEAETEAERQLWKDVGQL